MEVAVFTWLVGRRLRLTEAAPGTRPGGSAGAGSAFDVVVTGRDGDELRVACTDRDLVQLDGLLAVGEAGTGAELVRLVGTVHLTVTDRVPLVAAFRPLRPPEQLQRRQWVRVATALPVSCRRGGPAALRPVGLPGGSRHRGEASAVAVDLSGGGVRLSGLAPVDPGAELVLVLHLDRGPVEVEAEVLGRLADGTVRLRFVRVPEAVSQRIVRQVYAVQLRRRRLLPVES